MVGKDAPMQQPLLPLEVYVPLGGLVVGQSELLGRQPAVLLNVLRRAGEISPVGLSYCGSGSLLHGRCPGQGLRNHIAATLPVVHLE